MPTYGQRPQDVVTDSRGNTLNGITLELYETEALAQAGGTPLETVTTDSSGRWTYSPASETELWARLTSGDVWQVNQPSAASELATHTADTTDVHGIADTSTLIVEGDSRLTDARTPTAHTHPVGDLTATGTKDDTTFLRGDNTWAVPDGGGGGVTDHGALTGLADDDHTQYHNDTRGDARYYTQAQIDSQLADKADLDGASGDVTLSQLPAATTTAIGAVELATTAETTTGTDTVRATTPAGVKAVADTKAALSHTHAAADVTSGTVATARLGSGTADDEHFLRGDQTWARAVQGDGTVLTIVALSQAAYDALGTPDPTTLYVVT